MAYQTPVSLTKPNEFIHERLTKCYEYLSDINGSPCKGGGPLIWRAGR